MFQWLKNIFSLFYPKICICCNSILVTGEEVICIKCLYKLPLTIKDENGCDREGEQRFWGKANVAQYSSLLHFQQNNYAQRIIHKIKYKGRKDAALYFGKIAGAELLKTKYFNDINVVLAVPLHKNKEQIRGYNQSQYIAKGISETLKTEIDFETVKKISNNISQTKLQGFERASNTEGVFAIKNHEKLKNKHVLIVDDTLTTGATLSEFAKTIQDIEGIKISAFTLSRT